MVDNIISVEIGFNKDEIGVWRCSIDLHYKIYFDNKVHLPTNSSSEIDSSLDILDHQLGTISLKGKVYDLSISLTDDASAVTESFIYKNITSSTDEDKLRIELKLLRLQKSFADRFISNYLKIKGQLMRNKRDVLYLQERVSSSEKHVNELHKSLNHIDLLLPRVTSQLETEKIMKRKYELELLEATQKFNEDLKLINELQSENNELRLRLGDKTFDDIHGSLQSKYDELNVNLIASKQKVSELEKELESIRLSSTNNAMVDNLLSENNILREQCASLRNEVQTIKLNISGFIFRSVIK